MSDDTTGYPGQPPGATMAPPPPPPPGAFAAPQAPPPAPAPRKKNTALIVIIVLAVVLCGLGGCVAAIVALSGGGDTETISQAETHFSAMMSAVDSATVSLDALTAGDADTDEVQAVVEQTNASLRAARDEIAAARVSIEQLDSSEGKTDYLASLDAANESLDGLEDLVVYLGTSMGMIDKMSEAADATKSANELLNNAISAGNSKKYSRMKSKAEDAKAKYAKAVALFNEAHKVDTSAGLDQAAKYAEKRRAVTVVVIQMSKDGKAGKVSAYNKGISKMNKLDAQAEKIGEPAIVEDEGWLEKRLAELDKKITTSAEKADDLHLKALQALGYE